MGQTSQTLVAHSIALSTAITALFALVGMIIGWRNRRTTYAMYFAVVGGLFALGLMSVFKAGQTLGL